MVANLRSIVAGALALVAFQTVIATREGPGRFAGLVGEISNFIGNLADPAVPAFKSKAKASSPTPAPTVQPATYPSPTRPPAITGTSYA